MRHHRKIAALVAAAMLSAAGCGESQDEQASPARSARPQITCVDYLGANGEPVLGSGDPDGDGQCATLEEFGADQRKREAAAPEETDKGPVTIDEMAPEDVDEAMERWEKRLEDWKEENRPAFEALEDFEKCLEAAGQSADELKHCWEELAQR